MPVTRSQQRVNNLQDTCVKNRCHDKLSCEGDTLCLNHKIQFIRQEFRAYKIQAIMIRKKNKNPKYVHKLCKERGCDRLPFLKGKCARHSGVFFCKSPGCKKLRQKGGFCIKHGGTCTKAAVCKFEGCTKFNQGGGFCRTHGGGKRCKADKDCKSCVIPDLGFCRKHINTVPTQLLVNKFIETI